MYNKSKNLYTLINKCIENIKKNPFELAIWILLIMMTLGVVFDKSR